jgi:hypothetical protein
MQSNHMQWQRTEIWPRMRASHRSWIGSRSCCTFLKEYCNPVIPPVLPTYILLVLSTSCVQHLHRYTGFPYKQGWKLLWPISQVLFLALCDALTRECMMWGPTVDLPLDGRRLQAKAALHPSAYSCLNRDGSVIFHDLLFQLVAIDTVHHLQVKTPYSACIYEQIA